MDIVYVFFCCFFFLLFPILFLTNTIVGYTLQFIFPVVVVLLMLYCITRPETDWKSFFFLSYRLEDQTKKLHKDMKKSTEADLGVFCHQPACYLLVCHWSPLVHQHTWCCLSGFLRARKTPDFLGLSGGASALWKTWQMRRECKPPP